MTQLTYSDTPPANERRSAEELYRRLDVVRRGWRYLAVSVLICMTMAIFHVAKIKPVYKGTARLLLLQQGRHPVSIAGGGAPLQPVEADNYLPTHLMIIQSPLIVERAIALSGFRDRTAPEVIGRLSVVRPDSEAKILDIGYQAETRVEALKIVDAMMASYKEFLEKNYQKNTNEVITLITKARDELSNEVKELEKKYLEFCQEHPVFAATDDGRSLVARKLDKWDAASNEAMVKEAELETQLAVGRKLSAQGMDLWSVASALRMIGGGGGGGGGHGTHVAEAGTALGAGGTFEGLSAQMADVELKRQTAERLLEHLRSEQHAAMTARAVDDQGVRDAFYAEPEAAELLGRLAELRRRLNAARRLVKNAIDPSLVELQRKTRALEQSLAELWQRRRPAIARLLAKGTGEEIDALIRKAEADLIGLRSMESVLRERLEPLEAGGQAMAVAAGAGGPAPADPTIDKTQRPGTPPAHRAGRARTSPLLASIERSLEAIRTMRSEFRKRFEEDLARSKDTEFDRLTEAKLRGDLERHKLMFGSVVDQLKQAQLVSDYTSITAQTLNPASVTTGRPLAAFVLVSALVLGCVLGVGCCFLADMLDARLRTLPEICKVLDLSVLGLIPQLTRKSKEMSAEFGLVSNVLPRSMIAESYKSIRTKVESHRRSGSVRVIMIASPHSGDGKSTMASNLGISLAHAGRKVLLIDGDLRRPTQHRIFSLSRDRGLVQILKDLPPMEFVVQPTPIENLDFISAGPEVANPAELLASPRLGEFLTRAREDYDVVLIDSSPLLAVTDPSVIAATVDGILLVVSASRIRRHEAEQTMELLRALGTPVLGVVLNGITRTPSCYGYSYGYGYGYGNGTGHGYGQVYGSQESQVAPRSLEESPSAEGGRGNGVPLPR